MRGLEAHGKKPKARAQRAGDALPLSLNFAPMEAKLVEELPHGKDWQFEPKWDGFRCLAFRHGEQVELRAKSGKTLARYFPEVLEYLRALPVSRFILDGELAIVQGDALSFDALQQRLHPAESRVRKLARQTPAIFILFDCLVSDDGVSLIDRPLEERRAALEALFERLESPAVLIRVTEPRRSVGWSARAARSMGSSPSESMGRMSRVSVRCSR